MRCLKLEVCYRGTEYCGWQIQKGAPSVQEILERAFTSVTGENVRMTASGRTDAGVHAIGQVVSVKTESSISCRKFILALNAHLPEDIAVTSVEDAVETFHAIRDAKRKTYRYRILNGPVADPLDLGSIWHFPTKLDLQNMQEGCRYLFGEHDFVCFQAVGGDRKTTVRTIFRCDLKCVQEKPFRKLELEIEGNGFLYNMVRNIVGSLIEIGRGKRQPNWIQELIEQQDRNLAGDTAPAHGLFLVSVKY